MTRPCSPLRKEVLLTTSTSTPCQASTRLCMACSSALRPNSRSTWCACTVQILSLLSTRHQQRGQHVNALWLNGLQTKVHQGSA